MTTTTTAPTTEYAIDPRSGSSRLGGWLLTLSPIWYVGLIATMLLGFLPHGIPEFELITRAQMDVIRGAWITHAVVLGVATATAPAGAVLVVRCLRAGRARPFALAAIVAAALSIALAAINTTLRIIASGFTTPALGDDAAYRLGEGVVYFASFALAVLAVALTAAVFVVSGARRRTGIVVGAIGFVVLVLAIIAPAIVPPFVVGLLAMPLGIAWLRGLR